MLKNSEELVEKWKDVCLEEDEMMFSLDVEKMFTSLKRNEVKKEVERLIEDEEIIRGWKKEEIVKYLEYIWDNQYCIIEGEILKIKEGLAIGSRMSPVLAEILMKKWEKEKIDEEHRIRKFKRYVDDSIEIWRARKEDLERKVRSMEDSRKAIKLKLEVEEKRKIVFFLISFEI